MSSNGIIVGRGIYIVELTQDLNPYRTLNTSGTSYGLVPGGIKVRMSNGLAFDTQLVTPHEAARLTRRNCCKKRYRLVLEEEHEDQETVWEKE